MVQVNMLPSIGLVAAAYLLGSVPFGLLLARFVAHVDVRQAGSGNIGATNVARSAGRSLGFVTLLLDALKGALPVLLAQHIFLQSFAIVSVVGFAAVVGHVFPIYLWFRGGKGVATALGVFVALSPVCVALAVPVFLVVYALTRIVSLGSLLGALVVVLSAVFIDERPEVLALAVALLVLVTIRHSGNIRRILQRGEHRI